MGCEQYSKNLRTLLTFKFSLFEIQEEICSELLAKNQSVLCRHFLGRFCIENGRRWPFFIRGYHVYKEVWNPSIGEAFVFWMVLASRWLTPIAIAACSSPHSSGRRALEMAVAIVASNLTTSPSVTLLPNLRQVQIPLSSSAPEVYIQRMQYPGVLPLPKLVVLPELQSRPISVNFERVETKLLQVCELQMLDFFRIFTVCNILIVLVSNRIRSTYLGLVPSEGLLGHRQHLPWLLQQAHSMWTCLRSFAV